MAEETELSEEREDGPKLEFCRDMLGMVGDEMWRGVGFNSRRSVDLRLCVCVNHGQECMFLSSLCIV